MKRAVGLVVWLAAVWAALWEDPSAVNLIPGAAVGAVLVVLFPLRPAEQRTAFRPVQAAWFLAVFLWDLLVASTVVAVEAVTPNRRINEGIVEVPVRGVSDLTVTIVANAISLTPGTLVLERAEDPVRLYVHFLHLGDVESVRQDISRLEARAIAAFGPRVPSDRSPSKGR